MGKNAGEVIDFNLYLDPITYEWRAVEIDPRHAKLCDCPAGSCEFPFTHRRCRANAPLTVPSQ